MVCFRALAPAGAPPRGGFTGRRLRDAAGASCADARARTTTPKLPTSNKHHIRFDVAPKKSMPDVKALEAILRAKLFEDTKSRVIMGRRQ